jgi:hypothetical protein
MKTRYWIILGIIASLSTAFFSYQWASGLMDSLYAYRSPLASAPPPPGEPMGPPQTRRVVLVLVDALRYHYAGFCLYYALFPGAAHPCQLRPEWAVHHLDPA